MHYLLKNPTRIHLSILLRGMLLRLSSHASGARGTCDDGENFTGIDIDPNNPQRMKKTNASRRQDRQMEYKDED